MQYWCPNSLTSRLSSVVIFCSLFFFFSSRRRHTRYWRDWSSDVCSSDLVMGVIDDVNAWIDAAKPWELARANDRASELHEICSQIINVFRLLTVLVKPEIGRASCRERV